MRNDHETTEGLHFQITGRDYKTLKKFEEIHKDCAQGMVADQFSYTFIPTSVGLAISVRCSCGRKIWLGSIMDHDGEGNLSVLTSEQRKAEREKRAYRLVMAYKKPVARRITRCTWEMVSAFTAGVTAGAEALEEQVRNAARAAEAAKKEGRPDDELIDIFYEALEKELDLLWGIQS